VNASQRLGLLVLLGVFVAYVFARLW